MRNSGDRLEDRINPREYICKYDYIIYHSVTIIIICYCKIKKERNREMPLQGEDESRTSSPSKEAMDKSLKVG